jgi:hypothetical protein
MEDGDEILIPSRTGTWQHYFAAEETHTRLCDIKRVLEDRGVYIKRNGRDLNAKIVWGKMSTSSSSCQFCSRGKMLFYFD